MTLILAAIAALLIIGIAATVAVQSRRDEAVSFTLPADLAASPPPLSPGSINIAPVVVAEQSIDQVLADKEARAAEQRADSIDHFLPGNLGVGTKLTYEGRTSTIVGVFSFDFAGELWQDYLAEEPNGEWWRFGVEPDRGFQLAAFVPAPIPVEPGPPTVTFDGSVYEVTDSGRANYRAAGRTPTFETGRYHYFDYTNAQGVILSFERFDGEPWQTSIGHRVNPKLVHVSNL